MDNPETAPQLGKSKRKPKKPQGVDENPLETQVAAFERDTTVPAVDEPKSSSASPSDESPCPESPSPCPLPEEGKTEIGKAESRNEKPAHTVTVSDTAWERLQSQTEQSFWKMETLLDQIIRDTLHCAYPAITYGELCLAKAGLFRSFDRLKYRSAMLLKSDQGEFLIRVRPENPDYARWCDIYQQRGETAAESKAAEMAVFLLQQKLQEFPLAGAVHAVYPDDVIIERVIQPAVH